MASLGMGSSVYKFSKQEVNKVITKTGPGNYALGYLNANGRLRVCYVGRSDHNVASRIQDHLEKGYTHFKFCYATSSWDAYKRECENYHDFGESDDLDNDIHPDRPDGTNWKCPCCGF